jgi:hypothetical protein
MRYFKDFAKKIGVSTDDAIFKDLEGDVFTFADIVSRRHGVELTVEQLDKLQKSYEEFQEK